MHRQGAAVPSRGSGSFHIMQSYAGAKRAARYAAAGRACWRQGAALPRCLLRAFYAALPYMIPALTRRAAPWLCRFLKKCAGKEQGKGAPVRAGGGRFPFPWKRTVMPAAS